MKTIFYLVRHGIKEKVIGDVGITPKGIQQAEATAAYFSSVPIDRILTSPLRRAKETAQLIASRTKSPLTEDIRLRERANWGDLPDQTFAEFVAMWERSTLDSDYMPPVGDSAKQAGERLSSLIMELADGRQSGNNIVMVTHGGLITDYLVNVFSEGELDRWHPSFIQKQNSLVSECSITKLIFENKGARMEFFASIDHLSEPG